MQNPEPFLVALPTPYWLSIPMEEIPVEKIIRSRRRTIALEVTPDATLIVRAPHRVSTSSYRRDDSAEECVDTAEIRRDEATSGFTMP